MSSLKAALEAANMTVRKYDTDKARPVYTDRTSLSVDKFTKTLITALGKELKNHPDIIPTINSVPDMEALLEEYVKEEGLDKDDSESVVTVPPEMADLTLNIDRSSKEAGGKRFFCTTPDELVDGDTSGQYYMDRCCLSISEGTRLARAVVPRYMPRQANGVHSYLDPVTNAERSHFNTYVPPEWVLWKKRNPKKWANLPAKPPEEIMRLLKHIIPAKLEREYFYAWTYTSMTSRSFVYLVLQGNPGVGKNRLQLLFRALHGATNAVSGKKETFGASDSKFNSQMLDNTLVWFDELKYGPEMEPRMKEYQNLNISIERKGVDATSSSEIFSSMIISNNHLRDNYILFNSRKFAPLVLGTTALTTAMAPEEIAEMSDRLDVYNPNFDVEYVAQIAKWLLRIGPNYINQWPNLEYQGPKYWELAHSSMSRWQKIAVLSLTTTNKLGRFPGWDESKGAFLWSKVEEALRRKKEYESKDYRDASTVRVFFNTYCDETGVQVFETEDVKGSVVQDFWIKPLVTPKSIGSRSLTTMTPESVKEVLDKKPPEKLLRPPGTTEFKWRKMREEFEANQKGNRK